MAKKIQGITIEIDGDTTGLGDALKKTNKSTRELNRELRQVEQGLKFNPGNTELISQKQQILKERVEETGNKLEILKKAQVEVNKAFKSGEIPEKEYREFNRELIKTEDQLKQYQEELSNVGKKSKDMGKEIRDSFKDMDKESRSLAKELREVDNALKFNPDNIELSNQRVAILGKQVKVTGDKLKVLKDAQEDVNKAFLKGDLPEEEYRKFQREIVTTESKLKHYQKELENTGKKSRDMGKEIKDSFKDMDKASESLSKELKEVDNALKFNPTSVELSKQKIEILGDQVENTKDKLNTLKNAQEDVNRAFQSGEMSAEEYREFQREIVTTESKLKDYKKQLKEARKESGLFTQGLAEAGNKMKDFGGKVTQLGKEATTKISAPAGALVGWGTKMNIEFETGMGKISTLLDENVVSMDKVEDKVKDMATTYGIELGVIQDAVYDSLSAGMDSADVLSFVDSNLKTAESSFADLGSVIDATTTILNAYGDEAYEVDKIHDIFVETQNQGKISVEELGKNIGGVIPFAQSLGVNIDELGTSYALLTKKGRPASKATTELKALFGELGKSGSQVDKILRKKTGKGFAELTKEGKNTGEVLQILDKHAKDTGTTLGNLFTSKESSAGATTLLAGGIEEYNAMLDKMQEAGGVVDQQFDKTESTARDARRALEEIKQAVMEITEVAMPLVRDAIEGVRDLLKAFNELGDGTKKRIGKILLIGMVLGPIISMIGGIINAIGSLMFVLSGIAGFISAPMVAIAALIGGLLLLRKHIDKIKEWGRELDEKMTAWAQKTLEGIKEFFNSIGEWISEKWNQFVEWFITGLTEFWEGVYESLSNAGERIKEAWNTFTSWISEKITGFIEGIKEKINNFRTWIEEKKNQAKESWSEFLDSIRTNIEEKVNAISEWFKGKWESAKGFFRGIIESAGTFFSKIYDKVTGFWDDVTGVFTKIKEGFKNLFKVDIKLPKFTLQGDFGLMPPRVPKVGIKWNAEGAIFQRPTIFDTRQGLQGVGEAGPEAILPISKLPSLLDQSGYGRETSVNNNISGRLTINITGEGAKYLDNDRIARQVENSIAESIKHDNRRLSNRPRTIQL